MQHLAMSGSAQDRSTQEDLHAHGGRLPITRHSRSALELSQQIEQHQNAQKGRFGSEKSLQAKIVRPRKAFLSCNCSRTTTKRRDRSHP